MYLDQKINLVFQKLGLIHHGRTQSMEKADAGASLYYPLSSVVEHLLPGRVKLTLVIFQ